MAAKLSGTDKKSAELASSSIGGAVDSDEQVDSADFDGDVEGGAPELVVVQIAQKDPMIRRKIEDKLEQIRLRDELGLYEDDEWRGI